MLMSQQAAEDQAARVSKEDPNCYHVALYHTQLGAWIVTTKDGAEAVLQGGYTHPNQCFGYLRGYCAQDWQTAPIDPAFIGPNGALGCRSWIDERCSELGWEGVEEVDDDGNTVRIVVESPAGDQVEIWESPNYWNYDPDERTWKRYPEA